MEPSPAPPSINVAVLEAESSSSSPTDPGLLAKKVARTPGHVDSPGWESRMAALQVGAQHNDSSPQGAALLARKVERQRDQALGASLNRPVGSAAESALPGGSDLHRPPMPSRLVTPEPQQEPPEMLGGGAAAERPVPAPLNMSVLSEAGPADSSPIGAGLLAKKIARQKEGLDATCVRSGDQTKVDSPGWEVRMKSLETGNDAALADSSPQGAALLARKVERQNQALDGALRRPPDTGELQRPTPPSRLAGGSR